MFRNYLAAALGNLGRNGLYAGITILGLTVGFATAILVGLYVRDEYSFDRFLAGHERAYRLNDDLLLAGQKPRAIDVTQSIAAAYLKLDFPEVQRTARLGASATLVKIGDQAVSEKVVWVDPDFFRILPFPALAGDLNAALAAPDGLVMTRAAARKYFGQDRPLGRTILVNPQMDVRSDLPADELKMVSSFHPMTVMAVLDDLPASSHLTATVFASARAPFSPVSIDDRHVSPGSEDLYTYVQLKPGASAANWDQRLHDFAQRRFANPLNGSVMNRYSMAPLDRLHFLSSNEGGDEDGTFRAAGDERVDVAIAAVGVLVVAIAAINFVTLMTARAARRAVEVGVRKAVGARRRDLIVQFMGEALIYVAFAMLLAVVAAELALPAVNAFLGRNLKFDYLTDPVLAGAIVAAALLTVLLAGFYPALVLSPFGAASALKGGVGQTAGSTGVRQGLVVAQFAILIGLILMTATIWRQTRFALNDSLRLNTDQVVRIAAGCNSSFDREARRLAGVRSVACASTRALQFDTGATDVIMPDRTARIIYYAQVGVGFFEVHGLTPLAGRLFSKAHGEDVLLDRPDPGVGLQPAVILNETGARFLGYAKPEAAVGKMIMWGRWSPAVGPNMPPHNPSRIVGVVRDFTLGSMRTAVRPTLYYVDPQLARYLVLKLDRSRMPETLEALRKLWRQTGHDRPANFQFESQSIQALYQDVIVQGLCLGVCAGLAILIACLGLFALAAFVTERRTKEIGVRKALGASSGDVVRLLLWQLTQPVLWANLIAWPAAFFAMDYWLHGFAYRVGQPPWLFLAASLAGAAIAWTTVSLQTWMVARSKPVTALRYE